MNKLVFPEYSLPIALIQELRKQNPWWEGSSAPTVPSFRRWPFARLLERMLNPIAPILQLRGPRQTGKTTLQQQLIGHLLENGVSPNRIFRVQFDELQALTRIPEKDDPILRIADWFEENALGRTFNDAAHAGEPAFLFFDEVQNVAHWPIQMKGLVDRASVRALVTGSSALRIALGRDSLAGRIQPFELGPLRLTEIAALRGLGGLEPFQAENNWADWSRPEFWRELRGLALRQSGPRDQAFAAFAQRGAFPLAHAYPEVAWPELADQLNEIVIRRVIEHDFRSAKRRRKGNGRLLEAVFRMACRYTGQSPNPETLAREACLTAQANVSPRQIQNQLSFLTDSLLIRAVEPLEVHLKKRRSYSKLCLCDHALRAAWLEESIPLEPKLLDQQPHLSDVAGHVVESIVGSYFASLRGLDVAYQPQRHGQPEVDFVLNIGEKRIPIEVKYRRDIADSQTLTGLQCFMEKTVNNAPFGLLVTRDDDAAVADPRVVCLSLRSLLMVR